MALTQLKREFAVGDFNPRIDRGDAQSLAWSGGHAQKVGKDHRPARTLDRPESGGEVEILACETTTAGDFGAVPIDASGTGQSAIRIRDDAARQARQLIRLERTIEKEAGNGQVCKPPPFRQVVTDCHVGDHPVGRRIAQFRFSADDIVVQREFAATRHQWLEARLCLSVDKAEFSIRQSQHTVGQTPFAPRIFQIERNGIEANVRTVEFSPYVAATKPCGEVRDAEFARRLCRPQRNRQAARTHHAGVGEADRTTGDTDRRLSQRPCKIETRRPCRDTQTARTTLDDRASGRRTKPNGTPRQCQI